MLIFSRYTWWVAAMVGLIVLFTIVGGPLGIVQGPFLRLTRPVESVLHQVFGPVASILSDAGNVKELQEENARLRLANEELSNENNALGIVQATTSGTKLAASVVHRDSSAFTDVISIDRGSDDGIKEGMVVLSSQGSLLGTVSNVTAKSAFVRLITDSRSKVASQVLETRVDGITRGSANRTLSLELALAQSTINVGDNVMTSGLGGNYPPGLPIGRVSEVAGSPQDLFKKVTIEPLVRSSTVRTVLVLMSFAPERIGLD